MQTSFCSTLPGDTTPTFTITDNTALLWYPIRHHNLKSIFHCNLSCGIKYTTEMPYRTLGQKHCQVRLNGHSMHVLVITKPQEEMAPLFTAETTPIYQQQGPGRTLSFLHYRIRTISLQMGSQPTFTALRNLQHLRLICFE